MLQIFQTPTGEKVNKWHIFAGYTLKKLWEHRPATDNVDSGDVSIYHSFCGSGAYWVGGLKKDKPKQLKPTFKPFDDKVFLCPSCVSQAYLQGYLSLTETAPKVSQNNAKDAN